MMTSCSPTGTRSGTVPEIRWSGPTMTRVRISFTWFCLTLWRFQGRRACGAKHGVGTAWKNNTDCLDQGMDYAKNEPLGAGGANGWERVVRLCVPVGGFAAVQRA